MQHDTHDPAAQAAFYPYGARRDEADPPPAERFHPGAAQVEDGHGHSGLETYFLDRAGSEWRLRSQLFNAPPLLLARVDAARLPDDPLDAAADLLVDLWALRHPGRLRFVRALEAGQLGALRWRRVAARVAAPPLEHLLRTEGHALTTRPGPIGTTEHILLLRRA